MEWLLHICKSIDRFTFANSVMSFDFALTMQGTHFNPVQQIFQYVIKWYWHGLSSAICYEIGGGFILYTMGYTEVMTGFRNDNTAL